MKKIYTPKPLIFMLYFLFVSGMLFHIRGPNQQYMGSKDLNIPKLVDITEADLFETQEISDGWQFIVAKNKGDRVLDISGDRQDLIYYVHRHGGPNQRFQLNTIAGKGVMIRNPKGCIEYIPMKNAFERKPCDQGNSFQVFEIITPEELKLIGINSLSKSIAISPGLSAGSFVTKFSKIINTVWDSHPGGAHTSHYILKVIFRSVLLNCLLILFLGAWGSKIIFYYNFTSSSSFN